ncbi:phosphoribosylanthranilate isomerase [Enterococcus sp. HY326]|uniref:phosphoribosylanthranilate isomerase n=1 Tax=Enterococcus sp. HY326 TaxID=2971265 RepID=UPI00223F04D6|nr:phosphoribosylanthranilate isomerase [Enterococcus sp. HY326]
MSDVIIQIYGIRTVEDARMVVELGGNHLGICYGKNKRVPNQLSCEEAKEIFDNIPENGVAIGLTVAEDIDEITEDLKIALPEILHLSGDIEGISPDEITALKTRFPNLKIMQAIPVLSGIPLEEQKVMEYVKEYEAVSDFFLIDTKTPDAGDIGATGAEHDRNIDKKIVESTKVPCIIAGGLGADNIAEAIHLTKPYGVDSFTLTNYSDERADTKRCKDPEKVLAFVEAVKNA